MILNMSHHEAEKIARTFLSQNYSVLKIVKSDIVNCTWVVEVLVSSFDKDTIKKIKIDDRTRFILEVK